MISDGAFSIFKRFSAREKAFHEMPERRMRIFGSVGRVQSRYNFSNEKSLDCLRSVSFFHRITAQKNHSIGGDVQKVQGKFNTFNWFKSSIPLHFDMLNATPYSLSKEGNLIVGRKHK
jgi:hypothetical protein